MDERRDPLKMSAAALQRGNEPAGIRRGVAPPIIVEASEPEAVVAPSRTEGINGKAPHKTLSVRLFAIVEVAVVERTEVVFGKSRLTAVKFYRPLQGQSNLARRQTQIVPGREIDKPVLAEIFLPGDERVLLCTER